MDKVYYVDYLPGNQPEINKFNKTQPILKNQKLVNGYQKFLLL